MKCDEIIWLAQKRILLSSQSIILLIHKSPNNLFYTNFIFFLLVWNLFPRITIPLKLTNLLHSPTNTSFNLYFSLTIDLVDPERILNLLSKLLMSQMELILIIRTFLISIKDLWLSTMINLTFNWTILRTHSHLKTTEEPRCTTIIKICKELLLYMSLETSVQALLLNIY